LTSDTRHLPTPAERSKLGVLRQEIEALRQENALLQGQRVALEQERRELLAESERQRRELALLKRELDRLARKLFKKKSEKLDPRQLQLLLEILGQSPEMARDDEPVEMDSCEVPVREHRRKRTRRPLPKDLPRRRVLVDLSEAEKVCACGREKQVIGEARSEKIDYVPAMVEVVETVIPKYACPGCHDGVSMAKAPPQAFEKGLAAEGLLAHVVISKYADHLPLHRQEQIFKRHGLDLPRSTLVGFVAQVAQVLEPIVLELKRQVLKSDYLQTDDTSVVILDPDVGDGRFKGHFWTYLDPLLKQVVFDVTATREREGPEQFLREFRGFLQADAYTGYDQLYRGGQRVEVACWAHARRYFHESLESDKRAAIVLDLIQKLYQVEKQGRELAPGERLALRREQALPILAQIDDERRRLEAEVLPRSPLGEALRYLGNQWAALQRYTEDGRLEVDNNGAERQLRGVAVGRKNWLFAGSMPGAHRAALLYSLIQSCRLAGVEPFRYLRDVLLRVATHPHSRITELTPHGWAKTFGPNAQPSAA
jgi:transposase